MLNKVKNAGIKKVLKLWQKWRTMVIWTHKTKNHKISFTDIKIFQLDVLNQQLIAEGNYFSIHNVNQ